MSTVITGGTGYEWVDGFYIPTDTPVVITPTLVMGFSSSRELGNIEHPILGSDEVAVTLRPAKLRTGTLECLFAGDDPEGDSRIAEVTLSGASVFAIASDERPSIDMSFTVTGSIDRALDPETRSLWTVTFGFQEVPA